MTAWAKRPYEPTDENVVVWTWLKTFADTRLGSGIDALGHQRYWDNHRTIVMGLLKRATTEVIVDPDAPDVVWAFATTSPGCVHYVAVKNAFKQWRAEMVAHLLGDMPLQRLAYSHVMPHLQPMPNRWTFDPYCLSAILEAS